MLKRLIKCCTMNAEQYPYFDAIVGYDTTRSGLTYLCNLTLYDGVEMQKACYIYNWKLGIYTVHIHNKE